ncbi:MAG TPA: hypothetical protein VGG98_11100 [Solirubrobacteraceae bacterium]|jgi:hypothetical protein
MSPRQGARLLAAGRVALGVAVLAAPEQVAGRWLGKHAKRPVVQYIARSLGIRDVALGVLALGTLDDAEIGPRVQAACAAADSVDAVATIVARAELPKAGVIGTVAVAGAAAVAGFCFSHKLAHA